MFKKRFFQDFQVSVRMYSFLYQLHRVGLVNDYEKRYWNHDHRGIREYLLTSQHVTSLVDILDLHSGLKDGMAKLNEERRRRG